MLILKRLRQLMPKLPKASRVTEYDRDIELTAYYSRGSVRLQEGFYVTEEEMKSRRDRLLKFKFI